MLHAESQRLALTQQEVDEFMCAQKIVPDGVTMAWKKPEPHRYLWRAPIEVDAQLVGQLRLFAHPNSERAWHFKLRLHSEDVYRLDIRPGPSLDPPLSSRW